MLLPIRWLEIPYKTLFNHSVSQHLLIPVEEVVQDFHLTGTPRLETNCLMPITTTGVH